MTSNHIAMRAKTDNNSGTPCGMVSPNYCIFPSCPFAVILSEAKNLLPLDDRMLEAH